MSRPRRDYLQETHNRLVWWSEWMDRHLEGSCIGYPHCTAESRAGEGVGDSVPSSKVPDVMMPADVAAVEHAVGRMPQDLQLVVVTKYENQGKVSRRKLDNALHWLSGRITV